MNDKDNVIPLVRSQEKKKVLEERVKDKVLTATRAGLVGISLGSYYFAFDAGSRAYAAISQGNDGSLRSIFWSAGLLVWGTAFGALAYKKEALRDYLYRG